MPAAPADLVLLDLDGTLSDPASGFTAAVARAFRSLALPVPDDDVIHSFIGPPITTSFAAHGVPVDRMDEAVAVYREAYAADGLFDSTVYPGIPDQLRLLRDAGCTLVVATSKPTVYAIPVCRHLGLTDLVDGIHGATLDESRSTKAIVVGEALAAVGPRGRTLMVGDREHDVHGAAAHGIGCLGVTWGYALPGELEHAGAQALVHRTQDLAAAVLALLTQQLPLT